jgi:hypothetical protein
MNSLLSIARSVLEANDLGDMIKPAAQLYPHQWLWDSALTAVGLAHLDWHRATAEIEHLFKGQWREGDNAGFLPHIRFNPQAEGYFPGPDVWASERFSGLARACTSGITQPPIVADAAWRLFQMRLSEQSRYDFLRRVYTPLTAYHRWLKRARDPLDEGLLFIAHPWESGLDNSPQFDEPLQRIVNIPDEVQELVDARRLDSRVISAAQRPTQGDYYRYIYLVVAYREMGYNWVKVFRYGEFRVQEVAFNAIWCRSNRSLAAIARLLGEVDDAATFAAWADQTHQAVNERLWNPDRGMYDSFDLRSNQRLQVDTIVAFLPLFAGIPDEKQAERLLAHLSAEDEFNLPYPVPSTSQREATFDPEKYWRGPSWVVTNWFIIRGLEQYPGPCREFSQYLRSKTLRMTEQSGFWEYFNPLTGEGHGTKGYSWSAALAIDLLTYHTCGGSGL